MLRKVARARSSLSHNAASAGRRPLFPTGRTFGIPISCPDNLGDSARPLAKPACTPERVLSCATSLRGARRLPDRARRAIEVFSWRDSCGTVCKSRARAHGRPWNAQRPALHGKTPQDHLRCSGHGRSEWPEPGSERSEPPSSGARVVRPTRKDAGSGSGSDAVRSLQAPAAPWFIGVGESGNPRLQYHLTSSPRASWIKIQRRTAIRAGRGGLSPALRNEVM